MTASQAILECLIEEFVCCGFSICKGYKVLYGERGMRAVTDFFAIDGTGLCIYQQNEDIAAYRNGHLAKSFPLADPTLIERLIAYAQSHNKANNQP